MNYIITRNNFLFLFAFLYGATILSQGNAEVVDLTDATFEHQTQASTGATTGSWLILFTAPMCHKCQHIRADLETLSQDDELYEKGIVVGSVDAVQSPDTATRFDISNAPTMLFIHKKQVYRLDVGGHMNGSHDVLKNFVLKDFETMQGEPVPNVPSAMEKFLEGLVSARKTLKDEGGSATLVILGVAVLTLIGVLGALVVTMTSPKKNKKE